jgi:uncharacterized protein YkwD
MAAAAPRALIDSGPADRTQETSAAFAFRGSEMPPLGLGGPTAFECRIDSGPWGACTSAKSYTGLLGGTHVFEVRASGLLDDRTPAARTWVIEVITESLPCGGSPCVDPVKPGPPAPPPRPRRRKRRDAGGCPYAANYPGEVPLRRLETAVVCLFNLERQRRSLPALRANPALRSAATVHAYDMFLHKYFGHVSRGGSTPLQRVIRAGYFLPGQYGAIGEVLAWGDGRFATPRATVAGFMRSPAHREVILGGAFREVGVGVAPGAPARGRSRGLTVAAEVGRRG